MVVFCLHWNVYGCLSLHWDVLDVFVSFGCSFNWLFCLLCDVVRCFCLLWDVLGFLFYFEMFLIVFVYYGVFLVVLFRPYYGMFLLFSLHCDAFGCFFVYFGIFLVVVSENFGMLLTSTVVNCLHWGVNNCVSLPWDLLGCVCLHWDVLGYLSLLWDVLGCFCLFWDRFSTENCHLILKPFTARQQFYHTYLKAPKMISRNKKYDHVQFISLITNK